MPNLRSVGRKAEDQAADYLIGEGYTVVTRRYKTRRGEIDIVAMEGEVLVFVEVKSRRAPGFSPEEAMSQTKIDALQKAMTVYMFDMGIHPKECRLDMIAIDRDGIRHYKDILAP